MFEGIFLARTEDEQHPPPTPTPSPSPAAAAAKPKATTEPAATPPPPPTSTEKAQDGAKQDEGRSDSWTGRQWPSWRGKKVRKKK